jgi:Insertion element 4 transposase N-terminal/Transposase DDE domain
MLYSIKQATAEDKICQQVTFGLLQHIIPPEQVLQALTQTDAFEVRERRMNMLCVLYILMARALYPARGLGWVTRQVWDEVRFLFADPTAHELQAPTPPALTYRRQCLSVKALQALFRQVCQPLGQPEDAGCFAFGLRLMAIDSTVKTVADTPANEQFFGRSAGHHGTSAFPQIRATFLVECGTHAIIDTVFRPCCPCERLSVPRLLRSVTPEMLVLLDSGFYGYALLFQLQATGAHLLIKMPEYAQPQIVQILPDGSALVLVRPAAAVWRRQARPILMRLIAYQVPSEKDPCVLLHRHLLTTLLDPEQAPLLDLILCYHERWEIELTIKELFERYPFLQARFSSTTPAGVLQEFYGLLLGHYAIRAVMLQAARQGDVPVEDLSYTHAIQVITLSLPRFQRAAPHAWPLLLTVVFFDLLQVRQPDRPLRRNPRCVKRRLSPVPSKASCYAVRQEEPPKTFLETLTVLPYT